MSGVVAGELCMSGCDVLKCEGRCCYDGVYLQPGEEAFLEEFIAELLPRQN